MNKYQYYAGEHKSETPLKDLEDEEFLELLIQDGDFTNELWGDVWAR